MARRPARPGRGAFALSLMLHSAILVVSWMSTQQDRDEIQFLTYEIELVSPPTTVQAEEPVAAAEELVVETPETAPEPEPPVEEEPEPEPEPTPPPEREPEPEPEPEPTPPPPDPAPREPSEPAEERPPETREEPTPAAAPDATPEESAESGAGINVRLEGLRRDYPAYYENIINQIQRCFRWQGGGSWETTVRFVIRSDGTASDLEFVTRSGNTGFDFEAMGAVDCAGRGRFGALPEDLPYERLPIQFSFRPTGA